MPDMGVYFITI